MSTSQFFWMKRRGDILYKSIDLYCKLCCAVHTTCLLTMSSRLTHSLTHSLFYSLTHSLLLPGRKVCSGPSWRDSVPRSSSRYTLPLPPPPLPLPSRTAISATTPQPMLYIFLIGTNSSNSCTAGWRWWWRRWCCAPSAAGPGRQAVQEALPCQAGT